MTRQVLDDLTRSEILALCKEEASSFNITAALCYDLFMCIQNEKPRFSVLMILDSLKTILRYRTRPFKDGEVSFLIADRKTFEKDVASDWLGGLLVENLLTPYEPIINPSFLWEKEVHAKKRLITEALDNLVLEYPQMSQELLIKPEYFMFEAMTRKASLYPPIMYKFLKILETDSKTENLNRMMNGFDAALKLLAREGHIKQSDGFVKVAARHIDSVQRRKKRTLFILKSARDIFLRHSLEVFPKMVRSMLEDYGRYVEYFRDPESLKMIRLPELEEIKKHVFIPTSLGLVSFSDKTTIEDFVRKVFPDTCGSKVDLERLGGVLNAVYSLKIHRFGKEQKIVVKVFKDWYGWKWFPLKLWAFGTRGFSVLGKSRLESEYANNLYLSKNGCNVPLIIHVSPKERLIFQEFIGGESLSNIIKRIYSSKQLDPCLIETVKNVGSEIAKVHKLNLALGDCKPENIIVSQDNRVWFLDLEQAERGGDQAWDLAEFLFYSGHYGFLSSADVAQKVTKAFIDGYLEAGGSVENVEKARSPRYIKVFSFFTPPHILLAISSVCGKLDER
ncbi:MAG: lipopolysaccharide kinase InaA family protein [Candidatus Bathyarchaeia archaeon]